MSKTSLQENYVKQNLKDASKNSQCLQGSLRSILKDIWIVNQASKSQVIFSFSTIISPLGETQILPFTTNLYTWNSYSKIQSFNEVSHQNFLTISFLFHRTASNSIHLVPLSTNPFLRSKNFRVFLPVIRNLSASTFRIPRNSKYPSQNPPLIQCNWIFWSIGLCSSIPTSSPIWKTNH